ncbi:ribonuclease H-like domain-containing protein [Tanacetum coccineum]
MITRSKDRITRPIQQLNLYVSTPAAILKSHIQAIQNPNWQNAMLDEFNALIKNDLGPLNYFLGISATRTTSGLYLSQSKYASEILERDCMLNYNPCRTLADSEKKLGPEGTPVLDPTLYRSLARALQYLTFTRPDLSYDVKQFCLYMQDPQKPHLNALKHVLRYVRGTMDLGLELYQSLTS